LVAKKRFRARGGIAITRVSYKGVVTGRRVVIAVVAALKSRSRIVAAIVAEQGESAGRRIVTASAIDIECLSAASYVSVAAGIVVKLQITNCCIARTRVGAIGRDCI